MLEMGPIMPKNQINRSLLCVAPPRLSKRIRKGVTPCVYRKMHDDIRVFVILYVDDILLIGNDFEMLSKVKIQLATQFQMKDLGEAQYVLGFKII